MLKLLKVRYGPQVMMSHIEEIQALADHPKLRIGSRSMQAFDGFTQAVIGNVEARGKAFDMINLGHIDADAMQTTQEQAYKEIYEEG